MRNSTSLDTLCASLCYALGIEKPAYAAEPAQELTAYIDERLNGKKADRIFMYNPDAIGQWVYEKYPQLCAKAKGIAEIEVPFCTATPSVTPVCFATMYTGAQPAIHGIQKYEKPVVTIDTFFDALIRAGKKPVIVANAKGTMGNIFLERDMDYYRYSSIQEINAKAAELILEDKYDVIIVHNANYDSQMHKHGPESIEALAELRVNAEIFATFNKMIGQHWKNHNTLVGFAMDHGCHEIDAGTGSHGLDMDEDMNIMHLYKIYEAAAL